jgi:hypothetical protein
LISIAKDFVEKNFKEDAIPWPLLVVALWQLMPHRL